MNGTVINHAHVTVTLSGFGHYLCQIVFKYEQAVHSYSPHKNTMQYHRIYSIFSGSIIIMKKAIAHTSILYVINLQVT